ncbi:MAG: hypothetical protein Q7S66_00450 [bacterium]|nr:hypothetical protein [bacterium]
MSQLFSLFQNLPWPMIDIVLNVVAGLGAILIVYGVFLEAEKRQDAVFVLGAGCLLVYALWIGNKIFSVAMAGFMLGSFLELIEIMRGKHVHVCQVDPNK